MATKAFQKIYTKISQITKATCSLKATGVGYDELASVISLTGRSVTIVTVIISTFAIIISVWTVSLLTGWSVAVCAVIVSAILSISCRAVSLWTSVVLIWSGCLLLLTHLLIHILSWFFENSLLCCR